MTLPTEIYQQFVRMMGRSGCSSSAVIQHAISYNGTCIRKWDVLMFGQLLNIPRWGYPPIDILKILRFILIWMQNKIVKQNVLLVIAIHFIHACSKNTIWGRVTYGPYVFTFRNNCFSLWYTSYFYKGNSTLFPATYVSSSYMYTQSNKTISSSLGWRLDGSLIYMYNKSLKALRLFYYKRVHSFFNKIVNWYPIFSAEMIIYHKQIHKSYRMLLKWCFNSLKIFI